MSLRCWLALLLMVGVIGCSPSKPEPAAKHGGAQPVAEKGDYNPHDVPITDQQKADLRKQTAKYADAVARIKDFRNAVETETKNGIPANPYKAHQALDQVDLVLQWLPGIARDSGIPNTKWEAVTTTANELRTLFEAVHQNIDNKKNPDFASVAGKIDQQIGELEKIAK